MQQVRILLRLVRIWSNLFMIIDGRTNRITKKIPLHLGEPKFIAVNNMKNKIYVAIKYSSYDSTDPGNITMINGGTNIINKSVKFKDIPQFIAVNNRTNRIYVAFTNNTSEYSSYGDKGGSLKFWMVVPLKINESKTLDKTPHIRIRES